MRRIRATAGGLSLGVVLGPLIAGMAGWARAEAPRLTHEIRSLREGSDYRPIGRSTLIYGPTEIRVTAPVPLRVTRITVVAQGRVTPTGQPEILCRSAERSNACELDFGQVIARQAFRIDAEVGDDEGNSSGVVSERFRTLDAHPAGDAGSLGSEGLVERTRIEASPPDEVIRLVRVERRAGKGSERTTYRDDLTQDSFRVKVRGVRDVNLLSVMPPAPEHEKRIPILFNVATYLTASKRDQAALDWQPHYEDMVFTLVRGLRLAARSGVDAEFLVVAYAATGKVFGPFRLHAGADLDEARRRSNDETLEALEQFLEEPPASEWRSRHLGHFVDDFGSVVHTLNDLYLRGYGGLAQGVWITGGWSNPSDPRSRFQQDMWPERLEELNPEWSDLQLFELLDRRDGVASAHGDETSRLIEWLDELDPHSATRITRFLRELNPGATRTLHPHRVDSSPMLNVLFVPSDRMLRADRMMQFSTFIQQDYGGEIFRLDRLDRAPRGSDPAVSTNSVAEILERTYEQLVHSYVVGVEVPNPNQAGERRDLSIEVVRATAGGKAARLEGYETAYMPYYTASRSVRSRLADYLGSPFKDLRLVSAYELRKLWSDDELLGAWAARWQVETDDQVRSVLFESWVSINLKRLQAAERGGSRQEIKRAEEAHEKLVRARDDAARLPDPVLARDAALLAGWYRTDHGEIFGETRATAR